MIAKRASIELGSGCIRLQVAEVANEKIVNVLHIQTIHVEFARDLKLGLLDHFSQDIMDEAVAILHTLKEKALSFAPTTIVGIATEAFRASANAALLIARIYHEVGIIIKIATHEEEASYGFFNAKSLSDLDESTFISWDTGAGSFQITSCDAMYLGRFGRVPVEHYIIETLQKKDFGKTPSANPVSENHALQAISHITQELEKSKERLPKNLHEKTVIAIGAHPKQIPIGARFSPDEIKTHLYDSLNKSDECFNDPDARFLVIDLILAYSVMTSLNIPHAVRYSTKLAGNTSGLLIHPALWV